MRCAVFSVFFMMTISVGSLARVWAEDAPTMKKTVIRANELTFDYKRSTAVFDGDVHVEDPGIKMDADRMNILFEGTNDVKSVSAFGNVRLWHDDIVATCKKAVYKSKEGEVHLLGDAVLKRADDILKGDEITFWLDKEVMICKPGYFEIMSDSDGAKLP